MSARPSDRDRSSTTRYSSTAPLTASALGAARRPPRDFDRERARATALGTGAFLRQVRAQWAEEDRLR